MLITCGSKKHALIYQYVLINGAWQVSLTKMPCTCKRVCCPRSPYYKRVWSPTVDMSFKILMRSFDIYTCEVLQVTCEVLQFTCEVLQFTREVFQLTREVLQLTHEALQLTRKVLQLTCEVLQLTHEILQLMHEVLQLTCEVLQLTCEILQLTCEIFQLTLKSYITCKVPQLTCKVFQLTCEVLLLMPEERNYHVSVLLSTFNLVSLSHLFGRRLAIHGSLESKGVSTSSIFVNHKHNFDKINFDTSAILTM